MEKVILQIKTIWLLNVLVLANVILSTGKEDSNRANEDLEIIHSDVMGPFKIKSFLGARFIVTFIDDYSRKVFLFPIVSKSDVFEKFKKFKKNSNEI